MSMPSKYVTLFEGTSAANTAINSGELDVKDFDAIGVWTRPSGAAAAGTIVMRDLDIDVASQVVGSIATTADGNPNATAWGLGVSSAASPSSTYFKGGISMPLPGRVSVELSALGAGVTGYLRVYGRRNHRGPDVSSTPD